MHFIKPNYVKRLLKLKTPKDIEEWREERKSNYPTSSKRDTNRMRNDELTNQDNELINRDKLDRFMNRSNNRFGSQQTGHKFNGKFNKNNKFNKQGNKRQFNKNQDKNQNNHEVRSRDNEPKKAKLSENTTSSEANQSSEVNLDQSSEVNLDQSNEQQENEDAQNKANQINVSKNEPKNEQRFKRRRQPTLLEKMLLTDSKRNEDTIFKCIELIVNNNYLNNKNEDQTK